MSTYIFGIRLTLKDYLSILSQDASIGLYNVTSVLASNAASGQKDITVIDGTYFRAGNRIKISDDTPQSETGIIDSKAGNVITLKENLTNTYTTVQNAQLDSDSEFRWIYNAISGVSNWNTDMLSEKGLSKVTKSADIDRGGNVATIGGITIRLKNTQQFFKDLDDLGISLIGNRVEMIYFEDTTETVLFDGNCNDVSPWTKASYSFSAVRPRNKRNALMSRELNSKDDNLKEGSSQIGKMIPLTFGEWSDKPVKFIRNADNETIYENIRLRVFNESLNYRAIISTVLLGLKMFPVVGDDGGDPPLQYDIMIALATSDIAWSDSGTLELTYLEGQYLLVVDGKSAGTYRRISDAKVITGTAKHILKITVEDYFSDTLAGNATATAEEQSWVQFVDIDRMYIVELSKCKAYLDDAANEITQGLFLYSYIEDKKAIVTVTGDAETVEGLIEEKPIDYIRLPQYAFEDNGSGNKNIIDIDVKLFEESIDQMNSFLILPVENFDVYKEADLGKWNTTGQPWWSNYSKVIDGVFGQIDQVSGAITNLQNATDKDSTTYSEFNLAITQVSSIGQYYKVVVFTLPSFPTALKFDACYLGVKIWQQCSEAYEIDSGTSLRFMTRRFISGREELLDNIDEDEEDAAGVNLDCLPDFYFTNSPATNNKNFYYVADVDGDNKYSLISGYPTFLLDGVDTKEKYEAIKEVGMFSFRSISFGNSDTDESKYYELAVMFRKSVSIKEEIYPYFKGRIFDDTFGGRKTSTDLVESIVDIFETVCRSQDYSDRGIMPSVGWGKTYSESALIKTTGTGSFDSTRLNEIKAFKCARQVFNKEEMYTEKLKESICRNFFLLSYQDENGYECLVPLEKSLTSPTNIITFADIRLVNGEITVYPANPNNIYPEPFVRYYKDNGSDKLDGYIGVTNVTAESPSDSEKASYVIGNMDTNEAIALYDLCVSLYNKSGIITKPPSEMTDLLWANGKFVNAEEIAKWYIFKWVNWMGLKKISFPVHFLHTSNGVDTRKWNPGQTFLLQLPHETDNTQIECLCSRHVIDPNPPYNITIEAFMLDEIETPFFIQEVMYTAAEGADLDVQETMNISDTNIQEVT